MSTGGKVNKSVIAEAEAMRARIIELAKSGLPQSQIARIVGGVSVVHVSRVSIEAGIRRGKNTQYPLRDVAGWLPEGLPPEQATAIAGMPLEIRERLRVTETCWFWSGEHRKRDGRPMFGKEYAYRITYEKARGPIPEGHILHHRKCNNKACVNPWHTVPITQSDHMMEHGFGGDDRVGQSEKTRCPAGHPYDSSNTRVVTTAEGKKERQCRTCRNSQRKRYYRTHIEEQRKDARERQRRKRADAAGA